MKLIFSELKERGKAAHINPHARYNRRVLGCGAHGQKRRVPGCLQTAVRKRRPRGLGAALQGVAAEAVGQA